MEPQKLLLLEDDVSLATGLTFALEKQGFAVAGARTLAMADALWQQGPYSLLVLDVSLPDGSGFAFCRKVRRSSTVPIIFLTASDEETSMVMGLDMGADDYITKPFKLGVLFSRIHALLRRAGGFAQPQAELVSGNIRVQLLEAQATKNGKKLDLTAAEYRLLCYFLRNAGTVLTARQILENLWDSKEDFIDSSTLTVYIRRLRLKIEDDPSHPRYLCTVRGMGYRWEAQT